MGTAIADYQKQLQRELQETRERLATPSSNRIKADNKIFTLPNGQTLKTLECVVLDWRTVNTKYKGIYDASNPKPPVCWAVSKSADDAAPIPEACVDPQSDTCATCPFDQWGSASNGRGKECKNQRRLAVAPVDAKPDSKPMMLYVSPSAIANFEGFVKTLMSEHAALPVQVVCEVSFDATVSYTKLKFKLVRAITDDELINMLTLRELAQEPLDKGFDKT